MGRRNNGTLKKISIWAGVIIALLTVIKLLIAPIVSFGIERYQVQTTIEDVKVLKPKVAECEKNQELLQKDVQTLTDDTKELKEGQRELRKDQKEILKILKGRRYD